MTEIIVFLRSPDWCGAVVVATLISVIAAFLKDGLARMFLQMRRQLSLSREKRKKENEEHIDFLSQQPDLLSIEMQLCNFGFVRVIMVFIMLTVVLTICLFKQSFPGTFLFHSDCFKDIFPYMINASAILILPLCLLLIFFYDAWYRLLNRAYEKAKKKSASIKHPEQLQNTRK